MTGRMRVLTRWSPLFLLCAIVPLGAQTIATRVAAARQDAAFWLSRFAAAASGGEHRDLFVDDSGDDARSEGEDGLRNHAVFVLSQLPHREGIPALLDIARSNRDRKVRGQALFWLGQSGDARALALFESLLRG